MFTCSKNSISDSSANNVEVNTAIMDSHCTQSEHDGGSGDYPLISSEDVVGKDDVEEDTVTMDVFTIDEGEAVVVNRSTMLKEKFMQMVSILQELLNLLK